MTSIFLWIIFVSLIRFPTNEGIICPTNYNEILNGCYRIGNGTNMTWSNAQQYCSSESSRISTNSTGYITHLVALESAFETTSLIYWMKAWGIQSNFWTDGVVASSSWNWSGQSITWYFNTSNQVIYGNGSNYRLVYDHNQNTFDIADAGNNQTSYFICEYQDRCATNNSCLNNATCYLNVARELCLCAPGYTGTICDQQIDECLSSPCQHGGICNDAVNNYSCDCSNLFFNGPNCEIPTDDPTQGQRSAAFWSVVGVVCGLVVLLTLSDLPWDEIASRIGCPWYRFKCCPNHDDDDDDIDINHLRSSDSQTGENSIAKKAIIVPGTTSKRMNYHVMNTVWNPKHLRNESPINPQYNGYQTSDQRSTSEDVHILPFTTAISAKLKAKQSEQSRVYAVDIVPSEDGRSKSKDAVETMVSWTQQLQDQLKSKSTRPTSASSTKELIQSEVHHEND